MAQEKVTNVQHLMQDICQGRCKNTVTSGQYLGEHTHRTHKQIAELFSQAFTLVSRCVYPH